MTDVHFKSDRWQVGKYLGNIQHAADSYGEQRGITQVASMTMACLQFLVANYGQEQAERIMLEAFDAGFAMLHNADVDRGAAEIHP